MCKKFSEFEEMGILSGKLIHDLSNSMGSIVGATMLLKQEQICSERDRVLQLLQQSVTKLGSALKSFTEIYKTVHINTKKVSLRDLQLSIESILKLFGNFETIDLSKLSLENMEKIVNIDYDFLCNILRMLLLVFKPENLNLSMSLSGQEIKEELIEFGIEFEPTSKIDIEIFLDRVNIDSSLLTALQNVGEPFENRHLMICSEMVRRMKGELKIKYKHNSVYILIQFPCLS